MKKVFALLLSVLLVFTISGCNSNEDEEIPMEYTVGIAVYGDHAALNHCKQGIIETLEEEGIIKDENLNLITGNALYEPKEAEQLTKSFLAQKANLICAIGTPMAESAVKIAKDTDIPTVFAAVTDPVSANLKNTNATGVCDQVAAEMQLKAIRGLMPQATKIGIIYSANETNALYSLEQYKKLAAQYGFEIIASPINIATDIPLAADNLLLQVDCMTMLNDNTVVGSLGTVLKKANALGIPVFGSEVSQVKKGCIAGIGNDYKIIGNKAGKIIAKILKGEAKATDIPYETVKDDTFYINPEVMTSFDITLPEGMKEYAKDINTIDEEE
ncbi:MAG: ABC transporter substrate-binding protein [Clostridiales bacterium]